MKKLRICGIVFAVLLIFTVILTACEQKEEDLFYHSLEELQGSDKTFSLWMGCGYEEYVEKYFPGAKMVFGEFIPDLSLNVKQGKADAMIIMESYYNFFSEDLTGMSVIPEDLGSVDIGLIFSETAFGDMLRLKFNTWLAGAESTGLLSELEAKWLSADKSNQTIDYSGLDPSAEHIRVGVASDEAPHTFVKERKYVGYDTEVIVRFCKDCGYYPEISGGEYRAHIVDVQNDKFDLVASSYEITEERMENVSYSDPITHVRIIVVVNGDTVKKDAPKSVVRSFQRTFIEDNRAALFLDGIGVTLLITVLSVLLGTVFGFGFYFLNYDGGRVVRRILGGLSKLLHRVPSVVLLMVIYYIIFSSVNVNATFASIVLFTIEFSFLTFEALILSVNSVGKGQIEAAFMLGLGKNETFFRILLPQGLGIFFSCFKNNIVEILLASAVVGYVSVEDLTRVGDMIRNNTYESFFPLIAVAVFYLIISTVIIAVIGRLEKRIEPTNRSDKQVLRSVLGNDGKQEK